MDGGDKKRPFQTDDAHASLLRAPRSGKGQSIGGSCGQHSQGHAATPNFLPGSEANPCTFPKELAKRRARWMSDHGVFGILNRKPCLRASPAEFMVAPRTEMLIELAHGSEHVSSDKKVRRRAEAFLHISALAKKPACIDELGG